MWTRTLLRARIAALAAVTALSLGGALVDSRVLLADEGIWDQAPWLKLQIVGGRIVLTSRRCGQTRLTIEPDEKGPLRQSLAVESQPGALVASFEAASEQQTITLSVDARQQLTIARRNAPDSAGELRYVQPPLGPVVLMLGPSSDADQPRKYAAASLWHLLVTEPAAREALLPVLETIRPDWGLADQLSAAEADLIAMTPVDNPAQRRVWEACVDQLADPSFARRNEADLALRAAGQAVVVYLRQLDPAELDREQRQRIGGILVAICGSGADSPERVADWLVDCKRVWLALLSRPNPAARQAAASHLSQLAGKPIAIDPQASDERQARQLVELKALLSEH